MADQTTGDSAEGRRERLKALRQQRAEGSRDGAESQDGGKRRLVRGMLKGRGAGEGRGGAGKEQGGKLREMLADPDRREELIERFPRLGERLSQQAEGQDAGGDERPRQRVGGRRQAAARSGGAGAGGKQRRGQAAGRAGRPEGGSGIVLGRKVKDLETQVGELSAELQATRQELQELQAAKPKTSTRARASKPKTRAKTTRARKKK